jgi:ABC-type multidrug transport system fused ATPase/permease subunit
VSTGTISTGELVQAMALFAILAFPFRIVGFLLEELPRAVVAHDRITRVLAAEERTEPALPRELPAGPLAVELDDVRFGYDDDAVLTGVTAQIGAGEVVALVGSTGSGKSTLCALLVHLMHPDAGTIRLGGVPLEEVAPGSLHDAAALVFQESFLFADTLRENLAMGADVTDDELWEALETARARAFVERLPRGLDEVIGERGVTLSGGQRQRIALARALLRHPRLLLLDDATSAVDPTVERAILDRLRDGVAATTIVVAHRVSTIALADRVLLLDGGRIVAAGTHHELLAVPAYAALVRAYEADAA